MRRSEDTTEGDSEGESEGEYSEGEESGPLNSEGGDGDLPPTQVDSVGGDSEGLGDSEGEEWVLEPTLVDSSFDVGDVGFVEGEGEDVEGATYFGGGVVRDFLEDDTI